MGEPRKPKIKGKRKMNPKEQTKTPEKEIEVDDRQPAGKVMLTLQARIADKSDKFNKGRLAVTFKLPNGFTVTERLSEDEKELLKLEPAKKTFAVEIREDLRPDGTTWARAIVYFPLDWRKGFFLEKIPYQAYMNWRKKNGGAK